MRGEFSGVKTEIIKDVFETLLTEMSDAEFLDEDLWAVLFREAIPEPLAPVAPTYTSFDDDGQIHLEGDLQARDAYEADSAIFQDRLEAYNDASNRADLTWQYIVKFFEDHDTTERQIVKALEDAFEAIEDYGGGNLANTFYLIVEGFLNKFSLRYDLRRPFSLHPTLPGIFTSLVTDLKRIALLDANLSERLQDFEEALRDLKIDQSSRRIRICLQAQMNLLEAIGCLHPEAGKSATLGDMCKSIKTFPHSAVGGALSSIYGFSSDFSGVRHGKKSRGVLREVEMRDLISISVVLAGFVPYLTESMDADSIYTR